MVYIIDRNLSVIQERDRLLRENGDLRQEMVRLRVRKSSCMASFHPACHVCSDAHIEHFGS